MILKNQHAQNCQRELLYLCDTKCNENLCMCHLNIMNEIKRTAPKWAKIDSEIRMGNERRKTEQIDQFEASSLRGGVGFTSQSRISVVSWVQEIVVNTYRGGLWKVLLFLHNLKWNPRDVHLAMLCLFCWLDIFTLPMRKPEHPGSPRFQSYPPSPYDGSDILLSASQHNMGGSSVKRKGEKKLDF